MLDGVIYETEEAGNEKQARRMACFVFHLVIGYWMRRPERCEPSRANREAVTSPKGVERPFSENAKNKLASAFKYSLPCSEESSIPFSSLKHLIVSSISFCEKIKIQIHTSDEKVSLCFLGGKSSTIILLFKIIVKCGIKLS